MKKTQKILTQNELRAKKEKIEDYEAVCQICDKIYNRNEESNEIKESGEYICPQCWAEEE